MGESSASSNELVSQHGIKPTNADIVDYDEVVSVLAMALSRALARQHGWNESLNPRDDLLGVALGDQAGISADAPTNGAKETA
jgi:hypothetical protein